MSDNESLHEHDDSAEITAQELSESEIIQTLLSPGKIKPEDLVPTNFVVSSANAVKVALWILTNWEEKSWMANSRLTWLTGIVHYGLVENLSGLQKIYSPLMNLIKNNKLHKRACHLIYHLTTSSIFKWQVERMAGVKSTVGMSKPLVALLGRVKQLRPDLVPYNVPILSAQTAFSSFGHKFSYVLAKRSGILSLQNKIPAVIVDNSHRHRERIKRRKYDSVPKPEFINLQSAVEVDLEKVTLVTSYKSPDWLAKNIFKLTLPNQISSLLFVEELHPVLALHYNGIKAKNLDQWVYITLVHEFLEKPQYSDVDTKELILKQILAFQRTTGIRLNVVYIFLSEYLKSWDGNLLYPLILDMLRYVRFSSFEDLHDCFLSTIEQLYHQKDSSFRSEVISVCGNMIENLIVEKFGKPTRARKLFVLQGDLSEDEMEDTVEALDVITDLIKFTQRLCNAGLTSSSKVNELLTVLQFHVKLAAIEENFGLPFATFCQPTVVYLSICAPTPAALALMCKLFNTYRAMGQWIFDMVVPPFLDEFRNSTLMDFKQFQQYVGDAYDMLLTEEGLSAGSPSFIVSRFPRSGAGRLKLGGGSTNPFHLASLPAANLFYSRTPNDNFDRNQDQAARNVQSLIRLLDAYPSIKEFFATRVE